MVARTLWTIVAAMCALSACGGSHGHGGDDDGNCPDVSGLFTITQHCNQDFVGDTFSMTQTDCDVAVAVWDMAGTVSEAGRVTLTGSPSGETMTCEGPVGEGSFVSDCDNGCHVEGTRSGAP